VNHSGAHQKNPSSGKGLHQKEQKKGMENDANDLTIGLVERGWDREKRTTPGKLVENSSLRAPGKKKKRASRITETGKERGGTRTSKGKGERPA